MNNFNILDKTIETSLSNFGRIPYGYKILGKVFYDPNTEDINYACKNLTNIGENHFVDESPIILVHRGNCSFVTKVRNVEKAGGHVALIIDNTEENINRIIMADDGRGRELTIPGVLISKKDGLILTDYIMENKENINKIRLEVDFVMEHANNTVKYDLYTTSDNEVVYKLIKDFYYYQIQLFDQANLNVHYITYQNPLYVPFAHDSNPSFEDCLGRGKYCNNPGKFGTEDGREIVYESIKQKCVYKYAYEDTEDNKNLYWEYMIEFYDMCLNITRPTFDRECSMRASKSVGIPTENINKCIHDSYMANDFERRLVNFEYLVENSLLNADNQERYNYLINLVPSITINGRTFWGNWVASNLFEAICAGFNKKPEVCYTEGAFQKERSLGAFFVFMIIVLVIGVNILIFLACRRYIQRKIQERLESTDINHKINTVVSSYLALRETK